LSSAGFGDAFGSVTVAGLNGKLMSTTLIAHQRKDNQRKYDERDGALFAFRKYENPEQAFHFLA